MKTIEYLITAVLTFIGFMAYMGMWFFISSPGTNSIVGDLLLPLSFIAVQISILGVYIKRRFDRLEKDKKNDL